MSTPEKEKRFNYFDFLLDKSGTVLKTYLENPIKGRVTV